MSETNAPEPTMEEILASIRRIISEDEPAAEAPPAAAAPAALHVVEPEPQPAAAPAPDPVAEVEPEDILELTDPVVEPPSAVETHGDIEISPAPEPAQAPVRAPEPQPAMAAAYDDSAFVSPEVAAASAAVLGRLGQTTLIDNTTLSELVRELLKPLLKAWLDENLVGVTHDALNPMLRAWMDANLLKVVEDKVALTTRHIAQERARGGQVG